MEGYYKGILLLELYTHKYYYNHRQIMQKACLKCLGTILSKLDFLMVVITSHEYVNMMLKSQCTPLGLPGICV